jgi:hypothetical protein
MEEHSINQIYTPTKLEVAEKPVKTSAENEREPP